MVLLNKSTVLIGNNFLKSVDKKKVWIYLKIQNLFLE